MTTLVMPDPQCAKHQEYARIAHELVKEARAAGGLIPLDIERFWADQEISLKDPFGKDIPQCPLDVLMNEACIYDELGIEEDFWKFEHDAEWALAMSKQYNDIAERIVGRRLLNEKFTDPLLKYPKVKGLHDVFEAEYKWHSGSWWLEKSAHSEDELKALLDRVEARDVRSFILPPDWDEQKQRLQRLGVKPPLYRAQRGPVTFATSVYGIEDLIYLIIDNPDLAIRFRDAILKVILEIKRVRDEEAGFTPETVRPGFSFFDDNCCMLNPDMYELFGYPILKAVFEKYAPNPGNYRYQHSDSPMAHLLPYFEKLNMTGVNFGPTLSVEEIRQHCPRAVIYGQLAPFTFSRNEEENVVAEFLRDFGAARKDRGLVFATAGSINNGSRLTGMRLIMAAIQRFGRY